MGKEIEKLAAQIDVLKEEAVLEPARAESLKQKLNQLKDEASGENPVKTLEAFDHLQNLANQAAKESAEEAVRKTEQLAKTEALAEALRQGAGAGDDKFKAEAMAELAAMVQKAMKENALADKGLDAEALAACKGGDLSPEQLARIAKALKEGKGDLAKMLRKLREAELIDADMLSKCENAGKCDGKLLAALCKECAGKMSIAELLALCQCEQPGRGGVTEGPGAAKLTWGKASSEEGAKFKEEVLPPADVSALRESMLSGLSKGAPAVDKKGGPATPGALQGAQAGGGSAQTQVILPRHRGAVERYFDRPGRK
jgi:hypothetical protein